jgi:GNAT superfamily N-acetyltransferase
MGDALEIRRGLASDAADLTTLAQAAKAHWAYPPSWLELWRQDLTFSAEYIESNRVFVALREAAIVGVTVLESRGDEWAIEHVWVRPDQHGQGVGRAMVSKAITTARAIRPCRITVLSDPFAEEFYLRLGARRVSLVPAPMPGAPERTLPLLELT